MRAAVDHHQLHPELTARWDALLCSINDRLVGGAGRALEPLGSGWLNDLLTMTEEEQEAIQAIKDGYRADLKGWD